MQNKIANFMYVACFIRVLSPVTSMSKDNVEALTASNFFNNGYSAYIQQHLAGEFESMSGPGSSLYQTREIRVVLPKIIEKYNIHSLADAPCGDFNWMRYVALGDCFYYGMDIVSPIITKNQEKYTNERRIFMIKNVINEIIPTVDLILCRDCLVHFSYEAIWATIKNFKKSGSKYLLTTTFTSNSRNNSNIHVGGWQPLNLQKPPFNFPMPLMIINEQCTEQGGMYNDKSLALWDLSEIEID